MYAKRMSLDSIRFQNIRVASFNFGQYRTSWQRLQLKSVDTAYFIMPVSENLTVRTSKHHSVKVLAGELIIAAGGVGISLEHLPELTNSSSTNNSDQGYPTTTIESPIINREFQIDKHSELAGNETLVLEVDLCEQFKFGLRNVLPNYLHLKNPSPRQNANIATVVNQLFQVKHGTSEFSVAIRNRLGELLFIEAIDYYFNTQNKGTNFLKAMADRKLGSAVKAIHTNPETSWTVEKLARVATMSRSLFAAKFKQVLNETPLNYVRLCRIEKAKLLLIETTSPIDEVARSSGYASISSFAKAFMQVTGKTPRRWRDK